MKTQLHGYLNLTGEDTGREVTIRAEDISMVFSNTSGGTCVQVRGFGIIMAQESVEEVRAELLLADPRLRRKGAA